MEKKEAIKTVEMTVEEERQFEAFKLAKAKKEAEARKKADRQAYADLVDDAIEQAMPILVELSEDIARLKGRVLEQFRDALEVKVSIFGVRVDQRSHTFTNSAGTGRVILGHCVVDDYRDTVNEGIAMVEEYLKSLARDKDSEALVGAVLRLMSRDNKGTLKASRVLQLRKMAEESGDERFMEGVRVIEESYAPGTSKSFIRAERKDKNGKWRPIPLGMTDVLADNDGKNDKNEKEVDNGSESEDVQK